MNDHSRSTEPLRIVAIGGGTGLSSLLRGLKHHACAPGRDVTDPAGVAITAIVTVTDDGGSSGRLRRELDVLPPGDIRNCMVALSEEEALLSRLFQYRFAQGRGLKGHSFGNLFLTALTYITDGDFAEAVKMSSEILAICGRIYPSTQSKVGLEAVLEDGTRVFGERNISRSSSRIKSVQLRPRRCEPVPETLAAIAEADLICLGPGSLFTSVVPNLMVAGIPEAIRRSPATKAYFTNLMWQPGETMQFTAKDHIDTLHRHARGPLVDCAVVNTTPIALPQRRRYLKEHARPVLNDLDAIEAEGIRVVGAPLLDEGEKVRHSPDATAEVAIRLAAESRARLERNGHLAVVASR